MATRTIAGVFRSDAGFGEHDTYTPGSTFSSDLITRIKVDLGANDAIFDGDGAPWNEVPNDPTQTYDDGTGPKAFAYDYTIEVIGSDGITYQMVVFDYDLNNDGNFGTGNAGQEDPGENSYFMAFSGALPPPGITLTTTNSYANTSTSVPVANVVPCFTRGTLIDTPSGPVPIEMLEADDLVLTMDRGYRPIRWIGLRRLDRIDLEANPNLKPIRIGSSSLGDGYPARDLLVSPQHRILLNSKIVERMFGTPEILVPIKKLLSIEGIDIMEDNDDGVDYFHLLFDEHEIIRSNGAWTESLFLGAQGLRAISPASREEIEVLFPRAFEPGFEPVPVRPIACKRGLLKTLTQRHKENRRAYFCDGSFVGHARNAPHVPRDRPPRSRPYDMPAPSCRPPSPDQLGNGPTP